MPIFMDRHDLPESVTAEEVARLHQEDLKIEHKFGCKGMTYWFDEVRNTAFCLIQAPNRQALQDMHNQAHGAVANRIIEVEPSIVESFLGRIEDPVKARNTDLNIINDPAFRILMVIKPNTHYYLKRLSKDSNVNHGISVNENIKKNINVFGGRHVPSEGFRYLVSFESVSSALDCSMSIVKSCKKNGETSAEHSEIKIGLSSGLPFEQEEGLFKETIKHAARLCSNVSGHIVIPHDLKELYESENLGTEIDQLHIRTLSPSEEGFLRSLMDFMEISYNRADLKIENFSSHLGLSKAQLYRKVKGLTGKSLNSFVKDYRLEKALQLLLKKMGNISEVAFDTGFNSPAYFSKCFSGAYGILPSELVR